MKRSVLARPWLRASEYVKTCGNGFRFWVSEARESQSPLSREGAIFRQWSNRW